MASLQSNVLDTSPQDMRIIRTNELVTGPPGAEMIERCGLVNTTLSEPLEIMDNACGGGILTAELLKTAKKHPERVNITRIVASDIDEKMLSYVQQRIEVSSWSNVEVQKIDQQSIPLPEGTFSYVFNNFGIFFCPDDAAALSETFRILKPGGVAGFTSWESIAWWPTVAMPAVTKFIPEAPSLPHPTTVFPARGWSDPTAIPARLEKSGFKDIDVSEYTFTPEVEAEEFAEACAVLVQVITRKFWTEDENKKFGDRIEPAVLRYLQENFPNGRWNGQMVAIISRGRKS